MIEKIKKILQIPLVYELHNWVFGAEKIRKIIVANHIKEFKGKKILDIGCGTANMLSYLADSEYIGFDMYEPYIEYAKKKFGNKGKFFSQSVSEATLQEYNNFDIVIAIGILHHLNDEEAIKLFEIGQKALKSGGKLITLDPCYTDEQSNLARWLISKDRGKAIRTKDEYNILAKKVFTHVEPYIYNNLINIPYTHILLECKKQ